MILKCRYLAQFSMSELSKNAATISKAAEQCPFMLHAKRTLASSSTSSNPAGVVQEANKEEKTESDESLQQQKMACTNTINCPFFKNANIDLNKLLIKKDLNNEKRSEFHSSMERCHSPHKSKLKRHHEDSSFEQLLCHKKQVHQDQLVDNSKAEAEKKLFDYENFFDQKIEDKKQDGSYRYFKKVTRHAESFPSVQEHSKNSVKDVTIWCSNDYLGLGRHPYVRSRVTEAVNKYGAGSGGTRNISGSTPLHDKLENELASLHKKEAALLFTSCYVANDTTLYTMAKMLPNCHILSDSGNHASMIQGIRNSQMPKTIFKHNDLEHLEHNLKRLPRNTPKIVAFESVHSMDGSICELEKMCDLTHEYGGIAYIDEVHAVGLYGENGAGIGERDNVLDKMDIITGTLGKAFGNIGGYIAGSSRFVDMIRSYGSGFIFTTSLPPSVAAGALAAIEISRSDEGRQLRSRHQLYAKVVKEKLMQAGLPVMNSPSHIVPVMVGNVKQAAEICDLLMHEHGIYIQSINYPTVARGEERLRIVPNPHHSPEMVEKLVDSLIEVWQKVGLKLFKQKNRLH